MRIVIQSDEHILWADNIETKQHRDNNIYWNRQRPVQIMLRPCILGKCSFAACALGCSHGMQMGEVDAEDMRIDIQSDEHILWANNIETDNIYWNWQRPLQTMLRPMYPGQMHQIQRNLMNLVAIIDPGALDGLRWAFRNFHQMSWLGLCDSRCDCFALIQMQALSSRGIE